MKLIPASLSRAAAGQVLLARKHSPTILFGAGVVSMVGSTVLACRATLKLEGVLDAIENDKRNVADAKAAVEAGNVPEGTTYTDEEVANDLRITSIQGVVKVAKLYAPAVGLGIAGLVCLSKSHSILMERNVALTAAYVAVDKAFARYRERVVDRFGEDLDRELRYDYEEADIVDEQTGKVVSGTRAGEGDPGMYARWFDGDSSSNWRSVEYQEYNWLFLRNQQNWCNDMLRARGYVTLNEVYACLGLAQTSAGAVVGWVYDRNNDVGDNFIDFRCWDQQDLPLQFNNGREGAILLDFNVDGLIWDKIDELNGNR